jgi:hypothetical protein
VHIDEVPGDSTRAQICELFKSYFVNNLLIIVGVCVKAYPFLYIGEPCQVLPGPTAPLHIHKGATSWELRAVKFQLSCELGRRAPVKFYVSCELQPATFLPRRELSKFDFFINLCYNIIRKRKDKI